MQWRFGVSGCACAQPPNLPDRAATGSLSRHIRSGRGRCTFGRASTAPGCRKRPGTGGRTESPACAYCGQQGAGGAFAVAGSLLGYGPIQTAWSRKAPAAPARGPRASHAPRGAGFPAGPTHGHPPPKDAARIPFRAQGHVFRIGRPAFAYCICPTAPWPATWAICNNRLDRCRPGVSSHAVEKPAPQGVF